MADGESMDDIYVRQREFHDYARTYDKQLADLRLDLERTRARLEHLPDEVRTLTATVGKLADAINTRGVQNNPSIDGLTLAMQRTMDMLAKQPRTGNVGWVIGFCGVAVVAGYLALKMVFG